jgi:hypothetical protein
MGRVKQKIKAVELEPYWYNPDISLLYSLNHTSGMIEPGTLLKFKNDKNIYKFRCLVTNIKTGKEWIDVLSVNGFGWSSFEPGKLIGIYVAKKSRAKKSV